MFTLEEIEGEVRWLLGRFEASDEEPPRVTELAKKTLGRPVQSVLARALPGDGALVTVNGERRIYVRAKLPKPRLRWAIAHELGHHVLGLDSSSRENEDACNAFAAALLAPRRAFQAALRTDGASYTKLASRFMASESCVALRFGEVTRAPLALIAPSRVRVRGADFAWPSDLRKSTPGLKRATLRDDRSRTVVRVADEVHLRTAYT